MSIPGENIVNIKNPKRLTYNMNKASEEFKERLKEIEENSEVRFVINDYNEIFSKFDPRPLLQRGLSEDFLAEAKRASIVKESKKIDCIFLVPRKVRDFKEETKIIDRLQKYFKKHFDIIRKEKKKIIRRGLALTIAGVILMIIATFLFFKFKNESFISSFFTILLEPASWFLFWEGLDLVLFEAKKTNKNLEFHKKMADSNMKFISKLD